VSSFAAALERIKGNLSEAVPAAVIDRTAALVGLTHRDRVLTPVVTTHLALHRCLHRGTAITHLRRFTPEPFTPSAFCQAMARLPEAFFARLGFVAIRRDDVPGGVRASEEFASLCPASATVMHRAIDVRP